MDIAENEIRVGTKPFMCYVKSAEILLRTKEFKKIKIRARGLNISKAVDLAEAVKNKFCSDLKLEIKAITNTESFLKEGQDLAVSSIELTLETFK